MTSTDYSELLEAVRERQVLVKEYLFSEENRIRLSYSHLQDAAYSYLNAGGKSLRPAVLMFCCGAVGGDEHTALPAAAAVELYHTFTLVHDDIIDRDELRRGVPTVHHDFSNRAATELNLSPEAAKHYGLTIAILTGDLQQGWAASLLPDLYEVYGLPPQLALSLVKQLFRHTQIALINGETLDVIQSETPVEQVTEEQVLEMLWQKTGILYEFAGRAGAAIGLRLPDFSHPMVEALSSFTGQCGIAFQLQDDILGIVGNEKRTGKPVGSDIREGKRTVILLNSLSRMTLLQREFTLGVVGNKNASHEDVEKVVDILDSVGSIQYVRELSQRKVQQALESLKALPDSQSRRMLEQWASYIIERER